MDVEEIRKLVRLMEETGLTELEIEDRSGKVRLVRGAARRSARTPADVPTSAGENGADAYDDVPDLGRAGCLMCRERRVGWKR